jgi:hypothetical protein
MGDGPEPVDPDDADDDAHPAAARAAKAVNAADAERTAMMVERAWRRGYDDADFTWGLGERGARKGNTMPTARVSATTGLTGA